MRQKRGNGLESAYAERIPGNKTNDAPIPQGRFAHLVLTYDGAGKLVASAAHRGGIANVQRDLMASR